MSEKYQFVKPTRIIWAHLIKPRPGRTVNGTVYKPQYEVTFLFDPDHPDFIAIKAMLGREAMTTLGRVDNCKYPLERGDALADKAKAKDKDREFLRGMILFKAHGLVTRQNGEDADPPRLKLLQNGQYVSFDRDERKAAEKFFYPGVHCVGDISLVGYTGMGGGVSAYLNEILSFNYGERVAGGVDDETKYGDPSKWSQYVGTVSSVNPTVGAGEIPF
ncbi:MAG: ssDNA-binding protein [Alphaproteobacteria bacterium]